jgi:hypothetical protein
MAQQRLCVSSLKEWGRSIAAKKIVSVLWPLPPYRRAAVSSQPPEGRIERPAFLSLARLLARALPGRAVAGVSRPPWRWRMWRMDIGLTVLAVAALRVDRDGSLVTVIFPLIWLATGTKPGSISFLTRSY